MRPVTQNVVAVVAELLSIRRENAVTEFPRSLIEFQQRFPDEAACVKCLFAARWPEGFVCPGCDKRKAWQLQTKPWTWECAGCGRQTSVTAGTIMHHSKLPLTTWFWAAYLMATHSNGISALQLRRQLAFGSYKTARLMCAKLRRSMIAPGRSLLRGIVEVDETEMACRSKNDPVTGGGGRSHQGKILVVGAVEVQDGRAGPGRIRLSEVPGYSANSLHAFLAANLAPGANAKTDGWSGYPGAAGIAHDPHVVGNMAAPYCPALGSPDLLQPQSLGLGRLPWAAPQARPILPRRVRFPLQPPPNPTRRVSLSRAAPMPQHIIKRHILDDVIVKLFIFGQIVAPCEDLVKPRCDIKRVCESLRCQLYSYFV